MAIVVCSGPSARAYLENVVVSADVEIGERPGEDRGSNGEQMNTRFSTDRNEIIGLRFDLSSLDVASASAATLNLINYRDMTARPYFLYGVVDGAVGGDNNGTVAGYTDDDWDETLVAMSTMPGLIFDNDTTTQGINTTDTVNLGGGTLTASALGATQVIDVSGLLSFLQSSPDDLVTLLLARDPSNTGSGQDRFATKESTALQDGAMPGTAGDYASYLQFEILGLAGDTDNNGIVELADLDPIRANYLQPVAARTDGDLTGDFFVSFADFRQWKTAYLAASGSLDGVDLSFLTTPVPEPGSALLLTLGLALLTWRRRAYA